jgi:hypothetical protein
VGPSIVQVRREYYGRSVIGSEGNVTVVGTGIGSALRRARLLRGKSIEEASRETRIRADYLHALEREHFEALLGDVYVRGFLRSYSTYLGLDATKVLSIYSRHFGTAASSLRDGSRGPSRLPGSTDADLAQGGRRHPSWRFMIGVAVLVLAVFGAVGLLARAEGPPGSDRLPAARSAPPVLPATVTVGMKAVQEVHVTVWIDDGEPQDFLLREGEVRSFQGATSVRVRFERGGVAQLTVNDHRLGRPGDSSVEYTAAFGPDSFLEEESSPSGKKRP